MFFYSFFRGSAGIVCQDFVLSFYKCCCLKLDSPFFLAIFANKNACLPLFMKFILVILLSLAVVLPGRAQSAASAAEEAKTLNGRVEEMLRMLETVNDSASYYHMLGETFVNALRCDSLDALPGVNGKTTVRYRKRNCRRLAPLRPRLVDGGLYFYERHLNSDALSCFSLYLQSSRAPLFEQPEGRRDAFEGSVAYYAALLSFGARDYARASHYADQALCDSDMAMDAAEIKIGCMREMMRTPLDSSRYELALLELHDKAPQNATYFHMLISFLSSPGHEKELGQFAADEIRKDSNNIQALALQGEIKMRGGDLVGAVNCLQRVCRLDTASVKAPFNLALCYGMQARALSQGRGGADSCAILLQNARSCLEQVAQRDPMQRQVEWAGALAQIYRALGDDKAAKAMDSKVVHHENSN